MESETERVHDEDALYALPARAFVPARNALAAELRAAGRDEDASRVRKLRRPTRIAGAVNRAVRAAPRDVKALFEAVDALRDASRIALGGKGAEALRTAQRRERAALDALLARIREEVGSGNALAKARSTLLAWSRADADRRDRLRAGRLVDDAAADASALDGVPLPRTARKRKAPRADDRARTAREKRLADRRRAKREREIAAAESRARAARRAADLAEAKARALRDAHPA